VAIAPKTQILGIESRVQFIRPETIAVYQDILATRGKTLEVMIGFETQDDALRNGPLLNKGMKRTSFEKAVAAVHQRGARLAAYSMLMPVAMTERAAIDECLKTHRYLAVESTCDEIMMQARYSHHPDVQCPKLWSILQVLWESASLGVPVTLGDWRGELPEPKVWPKNCGRCDDQVMRRLDAWRRTLDPKTVDPATWPECDCRKDWEREVGLA
jgi:archaeosine synthase beta-subunit